MASLIFLEDEVEIPHVLAEPVAVVGRQPQCHVYLRSNEVSRQHAQIVREGDRYFIEDLKSRNGTLLNGRPVKSRCELQSDDSIQLGSLRFRFDASLPDDQLTFMSTGRLRLDIVAETAKDERILESIKVSGGDSQPQARLEAFLQISQSLAGAVDLDDLLPKLLNTLMTAFFPNADRGIILLKGLVSGFLVPVAHETRHDEDETKVVLSQTVLRRVLDDKQAVLSADTGRDERFRRSASVKQLTIHSVMCVPMMSLEGEPIGVINIDTADQQQPFSKDDVELLMAVAGQAALSYESARQMLKRQQVASEMEIERHRSLAEMVAGMAHEINTPLGIVNTAASLIGELVRDKALHAAVQDQAAREVVEQLAEAAQLVQGNIARANGLIQNFKKLSVRQLADTKEQVNLVGLIEEVLSLFKVQARETDLQIELLDRLDGEATWHGYPGQLSQVLLNLLANIQRYAYPAGESGKAEIEVGRTQQDSDPGFRIVVRDFGAGISPEDLPQIFHPFFTTGRNLGGSGLGLAIVYNLVAESLKGTIDVQSTLGKGSEFTITLPADCP